MFIFSQYRSALIYSTWSQDIGVHLKIIYHHSFYNIVVGCQEDQLSTHFNKFSVKTKKKTFKIKMIRASRLGIGLHKMKYAFKGMHDEPHCMLFSCLESWLCIFQV